MLEFSLFFSFGATLTAVYLFFKWMSVLRELRAAQEENRYLRYEINLPFFQKDEPIPWEYVMMFLQEELEDRYNKACGVVIPIHGISPFHTFVLPYLKGWTSQAADNGKGQIIFHLTKEG